MPAGLDTNAGLRRLDFSTADALPCRYIVNRVAFADHDLVSSPHTRNILCALPDKWVYPTRAQHIPFEPLRGRFVHAGLKAFSYIVLALMAVGIVYANTPSASSTGPASASDALSPQ